MDSACAPAVTWQLTKRDRRARSAQSECPRFQGNPAAVETWGWSWTPKSADTSYGLVRRPVVDAPGPAKPPKSRKLMRSATRPAGGLQRVYSNATGENDSDKLPPNGDLPQRPRTTSPRGVRIEEVRSGPVPPLPSGRLPGPALSAGRYQRARAPRTTRPGSRRRGRDRDGKE